MTSLTDALSLVTKSNGSDRAIQNILVDHSILIQDKEKQLWKASSDDEMPNFKLFILSPSGDSVMSDLPDLTAGILSYPLRQSQLYNYFVNSEVKSKKLDKATLPQYQSTILLVEDNLTNQLVARKTLELFGLNIDIADDGLAALDKLHSKQYDLVFMDCQMPGMDGYTATKQLRHLEKTKKCHTPVIALTANAMSEDRAMSINAGMDDHLIKPFTIDDIHAALEKWLPH